MIDKRNYRFVEKQLREYLAARFPEVAVRIGDDIHYKGTNIVVTAAAFDGLLPEQRFHHIVRSVPPEFYEKHLRGGVVWFELAPGEEARDYIKLPRSSDIRPEEAAIAQKLMEAGYYDQLETEMGVAPAATCDDDFSLTRAILTRRGRSRSEIQKVCLFLIWRGAFCDCEVATAIIPQLPRQVAK